MELHGAQNRQNNLEKKSKVRGLVLPYFETYYKAEVIKIVWYWQKDRYKGEGNSIESQEIKSHVYG